MSYMVQYTFQISSYDQGIICWESRLSLDQNPQVLFNDRIAGDKDPQEVVIPCHETHGEK